MKILLASKKRKLSERQCHPLFEAVSIRLAV
jgi:hypothetical protein